MEKMPFFEFKPEGEEKKKRPERFNIEGLEVVLEDKIIVPKDEDLGDNDVKQLLREIANPANLIVYSGKNPITAGEFDRWREKVQNKIQNLSEKEEEIPEELTKVSETLNHNYLNRASKLGTFIDSLPLIGEYPETENWRNRYQEITGGLDALTYNLMPVEKKLAMAEKLDVLIKDIYSKI
ncbi:MAG: hypothetical protein WC146_03395 [Patescibacteria group bacterium]|jgi:hypothetical protein